MASSSHTTSAMTKSRLIVSLDAAISIVYTASKVELAASGMALSAVAAARGEVAVSGMASSPYSTSRMGGRMRLVRMTPVVSAVRSVAVSFAFLR